MFADPLSLTIAGSAKTFNKVTVEGSKVVYSTATGDYTLTISHTRGKRKRSVFRLDAKKVAADPLLAERNVETNQAAYLVLDSTTNGLYSSTEQVDLIAALSATLTANTNALATKMVNGEL